MQISLEQGLEIVKVVGLCAGGMWTVWTFYKLQSARAAELKTKLDLAELLRHQPLLAIEMNVNEQFLPQGGSGSFLSVVIDVKNEGDQNLISSFDGTELTVARITFDANGAPTIKNYLICGHWYFPQSAENPGQIIAAQVPCRVFRAGQKRHIPFIVEIAEPGWYLIHFHTVYEWYPFDQEEAVPVETQRKRRKRKGRIARFLLSRFSSPKETRQRKPIDGFEQVIYYAKGRPDDTET